MAVEPMTGRTISLPRMPSIASDAPSLSTIGPTPSERFALEVARDVTATRASETEENVMGYANGAVPGRLKATPEKVRLSEGELAEIAESVKEGRKGAASGNEGSDDDDARSILTVTHTVTKIEDLPSDKREAIGTVLEEQKPKPVPLVVEFLGSTIVSNQAMRAFVNELYDAELELSIECQFLPKVDVFTNSDPFAEVYLRGSHRDQWRLLGRTEAIANAHFPRFVTKFKMRAQPEEDMDKQILVKMLAKGMQKPTRLGEAMCTIWDVISASGHCKVMKMLRSIDPKKESWIILNGDVSRDNMHSLAPRSFTVHVKFDASARPRSKTHFTVCRGLKKGRWTPVYKSEGHANPDREFSPAELSVADTFCGDERKAARIEFYQRRIGIDAKLAGFVQFSIAQLQSLQEGMTMQWWTGQDATPPGVVILAKKCISPEAVAVWLVVANQ